MIYWPSIVKLVTLFIGSVSAGQLRPAFHVTPPNNAWLNDPNGLFRDADGLWHVYYQYDENINPSDKKDWGHATSRDLWHWKHHPLAIEHDNTWGIWSGSAVIDVNNTSGFFPNQTNGVVAVYTQGRLAEHREEQAIAYSRDGGYTFENYDRNPVLAVGSGEFRDPKVFWSEQTGKWVMAVAYAADRRVGFFSSPDLKNWTHESNFSNPHLTTSNFECPNLAKIPYVSDDGTPLVNRTTEAWVLFVSSGSGSPLWNGAGSATRYFPGTFNGTHFTAIDDRADRVIDFGPDNYAAAMFHGIPDGQSMVNIGWAVNLAYPLSQPSSSREGWQGILTGVRSARLVKTADDEVRYHSYPLGLRSIKRQTLENITVAGNASRSVSLTGVPSKAVVVEARAKALNTTNSPTYFELEITFSSSRSEGPLPCALTFDANNPSPSFSCDRTDISAGWSEPKSRDMNRMWLDKVPKYDAEANSWDLKIILDRSILEVYLNGGLAAGTMIFFPEEELDSVTITTWGSGFETSATVEGLIV